MSGKIVVGFQKVLYLCTGISEHCALKYGVCGLRILISHNNHFFESAKRDRAVSFLRISRGILLYDSFNTSRSVRRSRSSTQESCSMRIPSIKYIHPKCKYYFNPYLLHHSSRRRSKYPVLISETELSAAINPSHTHADHFSILYEEPPHSPYLSSRNKQNSELAYR